MQRAPFRRSRDGDLLVRRRQVLGGGLYPNLDQVNGLCFGRIEFAVHDPVTRRHRLDLVRSHRMGPLMLSRCRQRAFEHVGDDLHVAVRMGPEAFSGADPILVHHAKRAESLEGRVLIIGEREREMGLSQPRSPVTALITPANGDHG